MKRKWIALILAVALLITMVPLFKGLAFGTSKGDQACYENLDWKEYNNKKALNNINPRLNNNSIILIHHGEAYTLWSLYELDKFEKAFIQKKLPPTGGAQNATIDRWILGENKNLELKQPGESNIDGTVTVNIKGNSVTFSGNNAWSKLWIATLTEKDCSTTTPETPEDYELHVKGKKVWEGDEGVNRPESIEIELYKGWGTGQGNSESIGTGIIDINDTPNVRVEGNKWYFNITITVNHDDGGHIANYFLKEVAPKGYEAEIENNSVTFKKGKNGQNGNFVDKKGVVITNTYKSTCEDPDPVPETVDITVTKVWNDGNNQDDIRPQEVVVQLYADGEPVEDQKITLTAANKVVGNENIWVGEFEGVSIDESTTYTVEEILLEGSPYTSSVSDFNGNEGFTITNTRTIDIKVTKIWEGGDQATRPDIEIGLWESSDGPGTEEPIETVQLPIIPTAAALVHPWKYTFRNLPKYDDNGDQIEYYVAETEVPGDYTAKTEGEPASGFTITNTYAGGGDGGDGNDNGGEDPGPTQGPDPGPTPTTQPAEVPATETTTSEIVAGDEDEKTTTTTTQPTEVVAGDEDEVDVVPTGENYLYLVVAILFILGGVIVLVPAIKKVRVKK